LVYIVVFVLAFFSPNRKSDGWANWRLALLWYGLQLLCQCFSVLTLLTLFFFLLLFRLTCYLYGLVLG